MIELQRNFLKGVMNKDTDPHFLPDGQYRDALNIVVLDSEGSHEGVAQNYLGNTQMNESIGGTNATCIGALSNEAQNIIYWLVAADEFDAIYEYNEAEDITTVVLKATKATPTTPSILNFNKLYVVTGINYINGLLFWTDNYNPPRRINIERCKNYAVDGFTEDDISVIVKPPLSAPSIILSTSGESNNLKDKFLYFAYRYKYLDNEYSALSPFSPVAFSPKIFNYDYGVSENVSMVNNYNAATITYNTGSMNVKEVQLVFRDTANLNTYIIDNFDKALLGLGNNVNATFVFQNDKVYSVLPEDQVTRLFDNVPLKAKSQEMIGSRLVYGNYTQFFNLITADGNPIEPNYTLSLTSSDVIGNNPLPTFKSNRDYEVGIIYLDDYARSTTVITPLNGGNTLFIPASKATKSNNIRVTINKDFVAPAFATNYRFVIKQNRMDYYNIFPLTYFSDGQFKWFLINQADQDKISVGDYIYLKSSTNNTDTGYKILDLAAKSANFLNSSSSIQPAGVYFKVKVPDTLLPDKNTYSAYGIGRIQAAAAPITNRFNVAEKSIFYGSGLNDMITSNGNAFTGTNEARFYFEIDSIGTTDTFKVYVTTEGIYKKLIGPSIAIIANTDQTISYNGMSLTIKFNSASGHKIGDYWVVNCRSSATAALNPNGGPVVFDTGLGAYGPTNFFTSTNWDNGTYNSDRPINAGSILTFKYSEKNGTDTWVEQTFISSGNYVNIEEWFYEEQIYSQWNQYDNKGQKIGGQNIVFSRGYNFYYSSAEARGTINQGGSISSASLNYPVYMMMLSYQGGTDPSTDTDFLLQSLSSPIYIETQGTASSQDIYYELSKTFPIIGGYHYGNVQNQTISQNAIVDLNASTLAYPNKDFNAFSFGNGIESYRIRDDWNAATMQYSPRTNATVEGYEQQTLIQALTYSGIYTQVSAINRLNEFNLSLGNFKYLDRFFGSIQKLYARDTDLVVFQENKVSKVLYGKNLLSDSVGGGTIASIPEVLGTQIAFVGEYGISLNPESFTRWGDTLYFTDARRGAVMKLGGNGLFEISSLGMKNWFKANLNQDTQKLGMMDPYFEHYILSSNDTKVKECIFNVTPTSFNYGQNSATNTLFITSNSEWYISQPSVNWVHFPIRFGNSNAVVEFSVDANPYPGNYRSTEIIVSGCDGNTETITISQAAGTTTTTTTTTTTSTTTTTTTAAPGLYDYYLADQYLCSMCSMPLETGVLVKFPQGSTVALDKFYNEAGGSQYTFKVTTADQLPNAAYLLSPSQFSSCQGACAVLPTTTTTSSTTTTTTTLAPNTTWFFTHGISTNCTASYLEILRNGTQIVLSTVETGSENGGFYANVGDVLTIRVNTGNQMGTGCQNAYVRYDSSQFVEDVQTGYNNAQIIVTVTQADVDYGIVICGTIGGGICPV